MLYKLLARERMLKKKRLFEGFIEIGIFEDVINN